MGSLPRPLRLCPGKARGDRHLPAAGPAPLPLVPILAVGTRAGHAAPLLPGLGLPGQGLLHLQLDLRGAQPTDGQVVPGHILHRQLLLACGWQGMVGVRKPEGQSREPDTPLPFCT